MSLSHSESVSLLMASGDGEADAPADGGSPELKKRSASSDVNVSGTFSAKSIGGSSLDRMGTAGSNGEGSTRGSYFDCYQLCFHGQISHKCT